MTDLPENLNTPEFRWELAAPTPEQIYAAYPRKQAKANALKAIAKAISKKRVNAYDLLAFVKEYAKCVEDWPESERQYVPLCASWVNGDRWEDDRALWVKNGRIEPAKAASRPAKKVGWM